MHSRAYQKQLCVAGWTFSKNYDSPGLGLWLEMKNRLTWKCKRGNSSSIKIYSSTSKIGLWIHNDKKTLWEESAKNKAGEVVKEASSAFGMSWRTLFANYINLERGRRRGKHNSALVSGHHFHKLWKGTIEHMQLISFLENWWIL